MSCMETTWHHSKMAVNQVRRKRKVILYLFSRTIMICLVARIYSGRVDAYTRTCSLFSPTRSSCQLSRLCSSLASETNADTPILQDVAIVGGGLAGLATAFHLLKKAPDTKITIFDKALPGCGGASSVAGGYVVNGLHSNLLVKDVIIICYSSLSLAHDDTTYNQDR